MSTWLILEKQFFVQVVIFCAIRKWRQGYIHFINIRALISDFSAWNLFAIFFILGIFESYVYPIGVSRSPDEYLQSLEILEMELCCLAMNCFSSSS
jgi:hypothetical protein